MQRVAGINTSKSEMAMSTHLKSQYISNLNGGKGVIYLTGTPITNSMSELYVLQNTLQPKDLEKKNINSFDKWVSTFGIVEESDEIKPEGTGYQKKMRLTKFHNLPELIKVFNNIADVKTAETLNLPRPTLKTGKEQIIKAELTEDQKLIVDNLVDRAEDVRAGSVDPEIDNFLKITLDARLLSIDPRILDDKIPYNPNTKLNICARKVAEIYHQTAENKSTQLIFCDSGTPKEDKFNFYDALKKELLENGVSKDEIAYIHNAKTDEQKEKLFEKVRNGEIRVLIGSTERMGVGTNVQNKLYALHNIDIPWRPDQLTQRNGRILRQGNENKEVEIFNYITEGSFDSYLYQILENKQKFISQVMTEKSPLRACDDIDEVVLNYAEIKGLAMKNPFMKEKMQVETEINKLNLLKGSWLDAKELYKEKIETFPLRIEKLEKSINNINLDIQIYKNNKPNDFEIILNGKKFNERAEAGEYFMKLKAKIEKETDATKIQEIGSYAGLKVGFTTVMGVSRLYLIGNKTYEKDLGISSLGNMTRLENLASDIENELSIYENRINEVKKDLEYSKEEVNKPFEYSERLAYLLQRKVKIDYNIENGITEEVNEEDLKIGNSRVIESIEIGKIEITNIKQDSLDKEIYNRLYNLGKEVFEGKEEFTIVSTSELDDTVLETVGDNSYVISRYLILDGEGIRRPAIGFTVENEHIELTSYLDNATSEYYSPKELKENTKLLLEIKEKFNVWLKELEQEIEIVSEDNQVEMEEIDISNNTTEPPKINLTEHKLEKDIYSMLYQWGNKVLDKETTYIKMEQEGFDDLVLEDIGNGEYSLAHYSELNGDMMRSPEITFKVEEKKIIPISYLDDYVAKYSVFENKSDKEYKSVIEFFKMWVKNIANQFYSSIQKLKNQEIEKTEKIVETNNSEIDYSVMTVNEIKETFKIGTLIKLENMQGENLPSGITGAVTGIDDIGQVKVVWENGSTLSLNVKEDKFEILNTEYSKDIEQECREEQEMWEEIR